MDLDPRKFAISPSISLVNQIGGAFHATSCRNLLSIVERGILPGAAIEEDYGSRYEAGRLHIYFGIFAPWDLRNTTTKQRVSGRGKQRMPLTVLCIPSMDLVRQGGRITDSGNISVSRPVPFNLVKEAWFCVPKDNDRRGFELVEKIMDERVEDELVLDYQPSPILRDFKKDGRRLASWACYATCQLDPTTQTRRDCCVPLRPQLIIIQRTLADIIT